MTLSWFWHSLWIVCPLLQVVLLALMLWRKWFTVFPIFALYIGYKVLQAIVLMVMNYAPLVTGEQYFTAYAAGRALATVLTFGVIYEIFKHVFRDYPALRSLGTILFRWIAVTLMLLTIVLAWLAPGTGAGQLMSKFYVIERTVSMLQCGLLIFLLLFSGYFSLSWRSHTFGLALGFGVYASMNLAAYAIRARIEPAAANSTTDLMTVITGAVYLCSVLVWMAYLLAAERVPAVPRMLPSHDLESWNDELRRLLQK